ncbi:hypothetical protein Tco_0649433 [Tanacetum coccineum]
MEKIEVLKSALKSSSYETTNIAAKVKNIEGKIRMPIRNVTFIQLFNDVTKPKSGDTLDSMGLDYTNNQTNLEGAIPDKVVQSDGQQVTAMKEAQSSFASVLLKSQSKQTVKISEMHNMEAVEGARVTIPMAAVEENTWAKFRLIRVMLEDDFFLFQFETKDGMEKVMEGGPWLIKLHHVSIVAYSEVGLSLIMTQIGRPIMLDTYTSSMYLKSWGRKEYDRALVEVSAEEELMESMVIAIPKNDGKGHSLATITIEYEWKPPRCDLCKVFDHMDDKCPKKTKAVETTKVDSDGFTEKEVNEAKQTVHDKTSKNTTNVRVTNSFSALSTTEADENDWGTNEKWKEASYSINESDSEEVEELIIEDRQASWNIRGLNFSPKQSEVHQIIYDNKLSICAILDTTSSSNVDIAMREFKECIDEIEVMDVPSSGLHFTWNQKPKGFGGLLKKIDQVLGNMQFNDVFVGAHVIFQPYRTSDHAPAVLVIPTTSKSSPKPFKFSNILTHHSRFKEVVSEGWSLEVSGFCMFRLAKKLKNLKKPLRKLLYDHGNLHDNVNRLRTELDRVQADLDPDPFNAELREEEVAYVQAYNQAILMQERFLKQKAKILWLKEGDSNSAYFYKAVKGRMSRIRIDVVTDSAGTIYEYENVADAFVSHYEVFLGQEGITSCLNTQGLFDQILDIDMAIDMTRDVCDKEIKEALFSMGNDKSPGPDGYTTAFFKEAWDIVGNDVTKAVKEFFTNGKLLKELNHKIIALIPKVHTPTRVNDYRPISCCNVLFKCISKIIANRIKNSLKFLDSPNQSDFVLGRNISDNILLTHELMHNYHWDRGAPRCAFKVDIQKAYDTVDCGFLKAALEGLGFHDKMIL